ncbi:excalibur calcium-binding domain-containing protein [Kitasatospora sp. NPDC002040]|uniref:excalibur calcium-binding domain-containing protein n=1 Tax=Kitasatospora sp. NPDC002040 TaxID=3154661 RepID=UPI0033270E7A
MATGVWTLIWLALVPADPAEPKAGKPLPPPAPETTADGGGPAAYYKNCDAVRAAGKAPLHAGDK